MQSSRSAGGTPRRTAGLLLALYALSGCAALVLETTWLRWLRLLFGATAPAVSATLVAFFCGQALGAAAAARFVPRLRRPLLSYGLLEAAAAACALWVPLALGLGESLAASAYGSLESAPLRLAVVRFAITLLATLPASLLLGATLPTLAAAWVAARAELAVRGTALYAANLLGAALGAALAAFWLPPRLGILASYLLGVGLLAAIAAVACGLGRRMPERVLPSPTEAEAPQEQERAPADALPRLSARMRRVLAALSGFGVFSFQVLLVRGLALVFDQSVYAFGAALVVVLLALALGSGGVSLLLSRTRLRVESLLALALLVAGIGIAAFPAVLRDLTEGFDPNAVSGAVSGGAILPSLGLVAAAAGLPLLAAGAVLPLIFAAAGRDPHATAPPEGSLGRLLATNTLGAIAGALAAPYLILEWLPLWSGFFVVALVYAIPCIFVPLGDRRTRLRRDLGLALAWMVVMLRASPLAVEPVRMQPDEELQWLNSGPAAVVAVIARGPHRWIRTDNHYDLGGSEDRVHQERQGLLAGLLRPGAGSALWIGSATGISAGALAAHPLTSLTLVELVPGVAMSAALFFPQENRGVHHDPRVNVVLDDARNYARSTRERFDLVVADLFVPWRAGTGSLYAREHFEAIRAHLNEDGAFVQWLPLYQLSPDAFASVAASFADVFPTAALFRGDFFGRFPIVALVGYKGRVPPPDAIGRAARRLAERGERDRWVTDPVGLWSLYVGPLAALSGELALAPRNTDDRPRLEFGAPRFRARTASGEAGALVAGKWVRTSLPMTTAIGTNDPVFPDLPQAARHAARTGARLQAAGAAWTEGRPQAAAEHLTAAAAELPPALLDPDAPDSSALELWPERR